MGMVNWTITPWQMDGQGGWKGIAPAILIEGQLPFSAGHPQAYIEKLQEMHDDLTLTRGLFYTYIGQFKDAWEQYWNIGVSDDKNGISRNGHRESNKRD